MNNLKFCFGFGVFVAAASLVSAQTLFNPFASRVVGQPALQQSGTITMQAPNLVEGRELFEPQSVAVDTSANPPILYVADTFNNRVLAWKNALGFQKGDPADLIVGQRDQYTTFAKGPGTDLSAGLNLPSGLAVDKNGNLYVADTGNNRVVRYPAPFQQTSILKQVDLVLGQKDITGRTANQGFTGPTEKTLSIAGQVITGLAFDSSGNLWISDGGNNRALRYPASALGAQAANDPAADVVLGQPDMVTNSIPKDFDGFSKVTLVQPGGLAFSPSGYLFVVDAAKGNTTDATGGQRITNARVLVYAPPFSTGQSAVRIMGGIFVPKGGATVPPTVLGSTTFNNPAGVFFVGETPFVLDSGNSRILQFDAFNNWPVEADLTKCTTTCPFSPQAQKGYGQSGFGFTPGVMSTAPNANQPQSSDGTFYFPASAVMVGTDLIVVDSFNNRVVAIPQFASVTQQQPQFPIFHANRVLGQLDFQYNSINLIEGREVAFYLSGSVAGGGVALDTTSSALHLYVADPYNNRILGFKDARTVQAGQQADLVIGQPDFRTAVPNYPSGIDLQTGNTTQVNDSGLYRPEGVTVDSKGDLWVADTFNGRVLRFPRPFDQAPAPLPKANLVIGQAGFFAKTAVDPDAQTMRRPYAIAFTALGDLVVSDTFFNRVLYFRKPSGGDFQTAATADNVIGQPDYTTITAGALNGPTGIAVDPNFDKLYVADTGHNSVNVYGNLPTAGTNPRPAIVLTGATSAGGFNHPVGVAVDQTTGECWVADEANNRLVRFPAFDALSTDPTKSNNLILGDAGPLAITLDAFGNPVIAESYNRIAFVYHAIGSPDNNPPCPNCSGNAANYLFTFAPGVLATIKPSQNSSFGTDTAAFSTVPAPTMLGDIQVVVGGNLPSGGVLAPLLYVSPSQINFQFPLSTPVSGASNPVEVDVVKASTGQTLAAWLYRVDAYAPGLFTADASGKGQLAAVNEDSTINGPSHPAKAGSTVSLYATGQGVVPGGPPDGAVAANATTTPLLPRAIINGFDAKVSYSGLAPGLLGSVWQINVVVPSNVPPGDVPVVVTMNNDNYLSNTDPLTGKIIRTTIRVMP